CNHGLSIAGVLLRTNANPNRRNGLFFNNTASNNKNHYRQSLIYSGLRLAICSNAEKIETSIAEWSNNPLKSAGILEP
ncbi:hypothetical protein D0817_25385, partial [Flavobacterium cupreum]